jgi:hypothetical protein
MHLSISQSSETHKFNKNIIQISFPTVRGRRGRDGMVVGFPTTYAISADHH